MRGLIVIILVYLCCSACQQDTHRLSSYQVHGIDVSHYQSVINWESIANQSIDFAFLKATEGETYVDSLFCRNWDGTRDASIKRGAYHFFRPQVSPIVQANNFIDQVHLWEGDLPPVLDVEVLDGVSKTELVVALRIWLHHVELHYNIKPILYTYQKFYNKYLAGHFDEYPIWIARYNSRKPTLADRTDWQFWQYGSKGKLDGVKGDIDFNVFRGSLEDLESLCIPAVTAYSNFHLAETSY
ncbi:MAG: GH25 family lysozyme [Bacteroidota bacterium]